MAKGLSGNELPDIAEPACQHRQPIQDEAVARRRKMKCQQNLVTLDRDRIPKCFVYSKPLLVLLGGRLPWNSAAKGIIRCIPICYRKRCSLR